MRSQKKPLAFDYNFPFAEGKYILLFVYFKSGMRLLKVEIKILLRNIECKFCITGEILFKLHADELKVELQNLLYELAREQMPLWKQMGHWRLLLLLWQKP